MRKRSVDVVVRAEAEVGEGPVWTPGELRWVELTAGRMHITDVRTGNDRRVDFGGVLGAVVPTANERCWAAITGDGFALIEDDEITTVDPVTADSRRRMNDGKCDSAGRFWAGSTAYGFPVGQGRLHRWVGGEPSVVVADGFTLPNGIGWSLDDRVLYVVESVARTLFAFQFDRDDGVLGDCRALAQFGPEHGLPDGLAVDADDAVWIAFHGGGCLRRVDRRGRVDSVVEMPVSQPTSCAFGAETSLFVTTAREHLDAAALADQPLAGSLLRIDVGVSGAPVGKMTALKP